MSGVHRPTYKEVNIGSLFKEQARYLGGAVLLVAPILVTFVISQITLSVGEYPVDGHDPFGNEIYAFNNGRGGDLGVEVI